MRLANEAVLPTRADRASGMPDSQSSRSPWVDALEDLHNAVVVREIVVRRTDRICGPTGGQRNASGNLWVRLFHQTLYIAEFLHERAGGLEGIAAKACDARQ